MSSSDTAGGDCRTRGQDGLSLRTRTAFAFLIAATAVSAAAFLALHFMLRNAAFRRIDRNVKFLFHERAAEYLTGRHYDGPRRSVPPENLPKKIRSAFSAAYPSAKIVECFSDDGKAFWFCAVDQDDSTVVAVCGVDPESLQTEKTHPADRISAISESLDEPNPGEGYGDLFHLLLSPDGSRVLAKSPMPEYILQSMIETGRENHDITGLRHLRLDGDTWAADTEPFFDGSIYVIFHRFDDASTKALLATAAATFAMLLGAGFFVAWRLAGSVVGGIDRVVKATHRASDGDYAIRIRHRSGEGAELGRLVDAMNEMLARTQGAIVELRELSDDMAHDLKTPLTRLLARAELAFLEKEHALPAGEVAEECSSMLDLVNALLDLSRAANGPRNSNGESADLAEVARRSTSLFSALAEDKHISLSANIPDSEVAVRAPLVHLQRIVANLLDNAIKFTPENGSASVTVRRLGRTSVLEVSNTGAGIAPEDLPHIFKRFWRSDSSRAIQGNGLGLALVKALAERAGGFASASSSPNRVVTVSVTFPDPTS
jgi:signal transduction histidine kinase